MLGIIDRRYPTEIEQRESIIHTMRIVNYIDHDRSGVENMSIQDERGHTGIFETR